MTSQISDPSFWSEYISCIVLTFFTKIITLCIIRHFFINFIHIKSFRKHNSLSIKSWNFRGFCCRDSESNMVSPFYEFSIEIFFCSFIFLSIAGYMYLFSQQRIVLWRGTAISFLHFLLNWCLECCAANICCLANLLLRCSGFNVVLMVFSSFGMFSYGVSFGGLCWGIVRLTGSSLTVL